MVTKEYIEKAQKYYLDSYSGFQINKNREWVKLFEKRFQDFVSPDHGRFAVAVNSGDSALHLAIKVCGLEAGDEVLVPAYSFVSTVNTLLLNNLVPRFVDIDKKTLGIASDLLEESITRKTKAIVVVHLFGIPADMSNIVRIARKHNLRIIEDCAQSFGSKYCGKYVGCFGDVACFSFNRNKILSSEEGGVVLCSNKQDEEKVRVLISNGIDIETQTYLGIGYSFRMTDWQACVLCVQLENINEILNMNHNLCKRIHSYIEKSAFGDFYSDNIVFYRYPIMINRKISNSELMNYKMDFIMAGFSILAQRDYILPGLLGFDGEFPCAEYLRGNSIKVVLEEDYKDNVLEQILKMQ